MQYTVDKIVHTTNKPFVYVDFNELLDTGLVMLSRHDSRNDYCGNPVFLHEGLEIIGYQEDEDMDGARDDLLLEGVCTANTTGLAPHVKWMLRGNDKGIFRVRCVLESGWFAPCGQGAFQYGQESDYPLPPNWKKT